MTRPNTYRATQADWDLQKTWSDDCQDARCLLELRARVEALEAGATCPHVVSSDEGTSYCGLAEQQARIGQSDAPANTSAFELSDDDPIPQKPAFDGSLVERVASAPIGSLLAAVHSCIVGEPECGHMQARAALREVVTWLNEHGEYEAAGKIFGEVER